MRADGRRKAEDTSELQRWCVTGVERLLYGSLSAVQCLLWLLYGAVRVDKHRVIIIEHRRPSCLHLTVTDWELRLHNTVSNPHSRIEYNSPDMSSQQLRHRNVLSKQCHFSEQNSNKLSRQTFENTSSCLHVVVDSQNHKQYLRNISSIFMHRLRWDAHTLSNRRRFLRNFTAPELLVRVSALSLIHI